MQRGRSIEVERVYEVADGTRRRSPRTFGSFTADLESGGTPQLPVKRALL